MALRRAIELDETGSVVGEKPGERLLRVTLLLSVRSYEEEPWKAENNGRKAGHVALTSFQLKKQKHLHQITQNKKAGAQAPATKIKNWDSTRLLGRFGQKFSELIPSAGSPDGGFQSIEVKLFARLNLEPYLLGGPVGTQGFRVDPCHLAQCRPHLVGAGKSCHSLNSGHITVKAAGRGFGNPFSATGQHDSRAKNHGQSQKSHACSPVVAWPETNLPAQVNSSSAPTGRGVFLQP